MKLQHWESCPPFLLWKVSLWKKYGPSHSCLYNENVTILLAVICKYSSFLTVSIWKAGAKILCIAFLGIMHSSFNSLGVAECYVEDDILFFSIANRFLFTYYSCELSVPFPYGRSCHSHFQMTHSLLGWNSLFLTLPVARYIPFLLATCHLIFATLSDAWFSLSKNIHYIFCNKMLLLYLRDIVSDFKLSCRSGDAVAMYPVARKSSDNFDSPIK